MLPALRRDYFRPDEMGMPELLFLGTRYARLLTYFDLDNRPAGDWQALFASDESALMGSIVVEASCFALQRKEHQRFMEQAQAAAMGVGPCPQPEGVPAYWIAERIQEWRNSCRQSSGQTVRHLHRLMESLLESTLAPALTGLVGFLARYDPKHATVLQDKFDPSWASNAPAYLPPPDSGQDEVTQFLTENHLAFLNALSLIKKTAEELFPASLPSGKHDPAIGLYLAFTSLYLKAKSRIDDFSQRHLRFYYDKVLHFQPRTTLADSAYLVLTADGATAEALIPKGTLFIGGERDDGTELLYTADDDLRVTDARITSLQTLHFERDLQHSPEKDLGYATAARTTLLPTSPGKQYYPLFGSTRKVGLPAPGGHARLGFAVASPVLLLGDGLREITITLHFQPCAGGLETLIEKLCTIIPTTSKEGAFFKAFAGLFRIRLTTTNGWQEVPEFIPSCNLIAPQMAKNSLALEFKLREDFPPVVGYTPGTHGEAYDTDSPVASFTIEPDTYLYPYDFLASLAIQEVDIAVKVTGCRDLLLYNNHGELSAATPFVPFGPLPKVGSHFIIGSREAFAKNLTHLEIRVKWDDLPAQGLENHYRAYGKNLDTSSFRAELSTLGERGWLPAQKAERIDLTLFDRIDEGGRTHYDCDQLLPFTRPYEQDGAYVYGPQARGGFIKLTLAEPAAAFGHGHYPLLLAKALTESSQREALGPIRRLFGKRGIQAMPEPPYTPLVSAIAIDYAAQSRISLHQARGGNSGESLYHLHPFGVEPLRLAARGETRLIPMTAQDANLFIGIAATELAGSLSLYFHLRDDSAMEMGAERPVFTWYYLRMNRWQELEGFRILSDSTRGFLTSGVIKLDLPRDMGRDNTVMASGLYWLRLSASGPTSELCSMYAVHTHGIKVTRVVDTASIGPTVLPAGSIQAAKNTIPGIASMRQPGDSSGGAPQESQEAMTIRASERLRHRHRAVTPWDYERLILQRFPHLHKVKCFANTRFTLDPEGWHQPGHLLIVVIPRVPEIQDNSEQGKENILVLQDIKTYLEDLASPFVHIDVRNPVFERIQVRCAAKFQNGGARGLLIKQLNRDICDFISPQGKAGNTANFGWSLRSQEMQGHLQGLPYVQSVWGLSLLRIVEHDAARYVLHDTAREHNRGVATISPMYPWSIALPFRHHLIETESDNQADPKGPWPSGISRLQVGATFIVSGNQHGEKE